MNMAESKFIRTTAQSPCPICGNVTGHCKSKSGKAGDVLVYCHNNESNPGSVVSGYKWIKASDGFGIFAPESSKPYVAPINVAPSIKTASATERDRSFRAYMSKLSLHPDDLADLVRRGISVGVAESQFVSIAGKEPGYLCPCYTPDGEIVGAQWRVRCPGEGSRYKWVSWMCGGSKFGDELPLTVHRPIGKATGIAIVEGIGAKSLILAHRSGMVTIGAGASVQFGGSSNGHWRSYLAALSAELNSKVLHFYPDSGCLGNAQVMGSYSKFFKFVVANGYPVKVAWWGQVEKGIDIDELSDWNAIEFIDVAAFEAMAAPKEPAQESLWKCMATHNYQLGHWKNEETPDPQKALIWSKMVQSDSNIEYVSERQAQANGSMPSHLVWIYRFFTPECNFDLKVSKLIATATGEGCGQTEYEITQLQGDRVARYKAIVPSTASTKSDKFIDALKTSSGAILTNRANARALAGVQQNREAQYRAMGGKTYQLAPCIGQQNDGYWIFENRQFTSSGQVCTEDESGWLFDRNLVFSENLHSPQIKANNPTALSNLASAESKCFHPTIIPFVHSEHGNVLAGMHRQSLQKMGFKNFPASMSTGEKGVGKTSALQSAASVADMHHNRAMIGQGVTESALDVRLYSLSGLPLIVDDPFPLSGGNLNEIKSVEKIISGAIQRSFDQSPRPVRGGSNRPPVAILCLSMNRGLSGKSSALDTRINVKEYSTAQPDWTHGQELTEAMDAASGGFGQLLSIKVDADIIKKYRAEFIQLMPMAQARQAESLAIQCYFTEQYCKLASVDFDAYAFHRDVLCRQANATDTAKDSLVDFMQKLDSLLMDSLLGEQNVTKITKRNGSAYLAIHMASVWEIFERRFSPNYSRSTIESLIESKGGFVEGETQKFIQDGRVWAEYKQALNRHKMDQGRDGSGGGDAPKIPKKTATRKCVLIPVGLVDSAMGRVDSMTSNFSNYSSDYEHPTPPVAVEVRVEVPVEVPVEIAVNDLVVVVVESEGLDVGDEVGVVQINVAENGQKWAVVLAPDGDQVSAWISSLKSITEI